MNFPDRLQKKIDDRKESNSFRKLNTGFNGVDFCSNDYLGFANHKKIAEQVIHELENTELRNGSTGSRLITGNHELTEKLEQELATFFKAPKALIFNSGYDANLGLFSSVPQHGDTILYDELCHASIRDGIRLSNSKSFSFKHNNVKDLQKKFENVSNSTGNTFLVVESIYSMDGDQAPLSNIVKFCQSNKVYLIVDEAHATGVFGEFGKGLIDQLHLEEFVFARIHTFGKAMGCHGAVILGSQMLINYLINFARSFIYTTALPLHNILTIKFALRELHNTEERNKLLMNIAFFKNELKKHEFKKLFIESDSPIQSCIIQDNTKTKKLAQKLQDQNIRVKAILSPTIPMGSERLRFCIHSFNTKKQIEEIFTLLSTFVH